jgi:hypothetical protein
MYTGIDFASEIALDRIRNLNDEARHALPNGRVVLSRGVASFSEDDQAAILERVQSFDDFMSHNDPFGEHDFGSFKYADQRVFWKIDYFDRDGEHYGSPDPSDPALTTRVLTIMLAGEY